MDANSTKKETLDDCRRCVDTSNFVSDCYPYTLAKFATIDSRRPRHNVEEMNVEWILFNITKQGTKAALE